MAVVLAPQSTSTAAVAANSPRPTQPPNKLAMAAQEFESILLASWLEKMNQGFVGTQESQDAAHDTVSSLGTQAIASALAARGGIGLASMLLRQLQPAQAAATNAKHSPAGPQLAVAGKHLEKD
jgi:Rod binding domain-containing protein